MEDLYAQPKRSATNKVMDYALPAMAILEAIITGKASKGNYIGTTGLDVMNARAAQEGAQEARRQKAVERAQANQDRILASADRLRKNGYEDAKAKREAATWEQTDKESQEKANTRAATVDRLLGIPNEYDEKTNTVTRSGVPGVPDLTPEDKASIQADPISWLTNRLKPQPTQLVLGNDGTYKSVNKVTAKDQDGNTVVAPPKPVPGTSPGKPPAGYRYTKAGALEAIPGGPADKGDKPPTEDMTKAANFARRMELAQHDLAEVEAAGYDRAANQNSLKASGPSAFNSPLGQRYSNAEKNFATANLRKESGAVIGDNEMKNQESLYFPRWGDSEEVKAQKARNRAQAYEGMKSAAGKQFEKVPSMIPVKTLEEAVDRSVAGINSGTVWRKAADGKEYEYDAETKKPTGKVR